MYTFLIVLLIIASIALIALILLQPSPGHGLSETLGGGMAESILGSRASSFLVKATTIFAILFFIASLGVTILSAKRGKSLIKEQPAVKKQSQNLPKKQEKENVKKQPTASAESSKKQPAEK